MTRPGPAASHPRAASSSAPARPVVSATQVVALTRTGAPALRLRARLIDARRAMCGPDLVELSLWAREPVGWALSIAARPAGPDAKIVAEAHLCDTFAAVCGRIEAWAAPAPALPVAWRAAWTADSAADALCARLASTRRQAAVERFVGDVLADWMQAIPSED